MTDREKDLRSKIRLECREVECNFEGIDYLIKMENDWRVCQKEDDYSFNSCPNSFKCLEDYVGLCETDDKEFTGNTLEQCERCWKKALRGE